MPTCTMSPGLQPSRVVSTSAEAPRSRIVRTLYLGACNSRRLRGVGGASSAQLRAPKRGLGVWGKRMASGVFPGNPPPPMRRAQRRAVGTKADAGGSLAMEADAGGSRPVQKATTVVFTGLALGTALSALTSWCLPFWSALMMPQYVRYAVAALCALVVAGGGYKKRSLDLSGACSAVVVGWVTFAASVATGVTLVAFFVSSSMFTNFGGKVKEKSDEEFKKGGQRNYVQVFANGGIPTVLAALCAVLAAFKQPVLSSHAHLWVVGAVICKLPATMCAFVGYYSCCCGDTWASELGVLSKTPPRLITSFEVVPAGTNGGITFLGTAASAAGGLWIGLWFFLASLPFHRADPTAQLGKLLFVVPLGLTAGLVGSFIDSLLGATIQFSGYDTIHKKITGSPGPGVEHISGLRILNNHAVNFVSAVLTALLTAAAGMILV